ncbi:MAG: class I fructose-bisphosphate aldolase [Candidatus Pelagibacterales bacterium]|jgi:fructose-bisphosphate aldolase class I|tara:strand:+ start:1645 stop:2658 length:1014 start_codon:yes stop_codon:yes gene_type:complete
MSLTNLNEIAEYILSNGKGILAADESTGTIKKRFDSIDTESTELSRRTYREMLFQADGMKGNIGGVILFDETLRQLGADGTLLSEIISNQGALPGIKVDKGLSPLDENSLETVTMGLDDLDERCKEYFKLGAKFTKWRAVINIGNGIPTDKCIEENMIRLADYAKIVQNNNMVPIVEPEVLMDGSHTLNDCFIVTSKVLNSLFIQLKSKDVNIKGTILKPNMVISGTNCSEQAGVQEVAEQTVKCLIENVPEDLSGIAFLSGGQSDIDATAHLDAMNKIGGFKWKLSFSYGRALQQAALKTWLGKEENITSAQSAFSHRALMNKKAATGEWHTGLEN